MVNIRWAGSGFFCALFLLVLGTASCSRGRSDAELTGEAQSRISADRRMQTNGFCIQRGLVVRTDRTDAVIRTHPGGTLPVEIAHRNNFWCLPSSCGRSGCLCRIASKTAAEVLPANGRTPVAIS